MGQYKPVVVYRFCTKNTIDENIIARAGAKRKLEKIIIGSGKILHQKFIILYCFILYMFQVPIININRIITKN
jgi:hypothetical protein